MSYSFVIVHSPLIGPFSLQPVAAQLQHLGHQTVTPSLLPALRRSSDFVNAIAQCVREAVTESDVSDPLVLIGHSAAGAFLPVVASQLDREVQAYVFVDARLPRRDASLADEDSLEAAKRLREMTEDGLLPPWSEWFGEGAMREVIPQDDERKRFVAELQRIPIALFSEEISFSSNWPDAPCAYLRLSEFYKPLAREALAMGWTVIEIDGQHLHTLTHPEEVADLLQEVLGQLEIQ